MKKTADNRGIARVSSLARQIADGEITDLSDWDEGELMMGRRRDKNGKFRGKPPKLIPLQILQELNRRKGRRTMALFMNHLESCAKVIVDIAERKKPREGDAIRLKAAQSVVDRILGRPAESLMLDMHTDGSLVAPWQRLMASSIIASADELKRLKAGDEDEEDIEEGEVVEERVFKRKRLR